jgi:tRNA(fMet)-specific endonuclease VapC
MSGRPVQGRSARGRDTLQSCSKSNRLRRVVRAKVRHEIVAFELWYGVAKRQFKESNTVRLDAFFAGPLEWTLFDEEDARAAGTIRAELEAIGQPIGAYDVLLAGQARRHGATLVTSNTREFARVSGPKWEDWAASRR